MNRFLCTVCLLLALCLLWFLPGCGVQTSGPADASPTPAPTQAAEQQGEEGTITDADVEQFMNQVLSENKAWPASLLPSGLPAIQDEYVVTYDVDGNTVFIRVSENEEQLAGYLTSLTAQGWLKTEKGVSKGDYIITFTYGQSYTDISVSSYALQSWPNEAMPDVPQLAGTYYSKPTSRKSGNDTYVFFVLNSANQADLDAYPALLKGKGFEQNEAADSYIKENVTYKGTSCTLTVEYSLEAATGKVYIAAEYSTDASPSPGTSPTPSASPKAAVSPSQSSSPSSSPAN